MNLSSPSGGKLCTVKYIVKNCRLNDASLNQLLPSMYWDLQRVVFSLFSVMTDFFSFKKLVQSLLFILLLITWLQWLGHNRGERIIGYFTYSLILWMWVSALLFNKYTAVGMRLTSLCLVSLIYDPEVII